jgi:hypothetical protein
MQAIADGFAEFEVSPGVSFLRQRTIAGMVNGNRWGARVPADRKPVIAMAESRLELNQKLRRLVQQLGEAIHETVSESEQIAGVVADIRKQGFEVLLMLEATIGLNELEQQPAGSALPSKSEQDEDGTFTEHDVSFLKSLRISVAGDDEPA